MCQLCWDSNQQMEPTHNKLSNGFHAAPPNSLTSCNSSASSCSDNSVDFNSQDGHNLEVGRSESGRHDYRSESASSMNFVGDSGNQKENNGYENEDFDLGTSFKSVDLIDDDGSSDDEVDEPSPSPAFDYTDEIWDPPDAEDKEDDKENSMSFLADDDDECADGDGTEWVNLSLMTSFRERVEEEKRKAMDEMMNGKFKNLVSQLLKKLGVDNNDKMGESWVDIVTELAWKAASFVKPVMNDGKTMDPAGYVKIKCVATGSPTESQLIKGLVFKKHAAHKHMPTKYKNPRLLLIRGMLGQSSSLSGLSSFNSMIDQDKGSKIADKDSKIADVIENLKACHANVILVEKSASRDVLEAVLKLGVTLVLDMKLHRLERVSDCTGSPILPSDVPFSQELKHCDSVNFEKFVEEHSVVGEGGKKPIKTLMFLEGCPTRLGCTILLKGSSSEKLKKVKCVVQCAVVMAYHFILETSFLVDQRAMFSTITFGQSTNTLFTNEHTPSVVSETSIGPLNEEPNVTGDSGVGVLIPISNGSDEDSSFIQNPTSKTASSSHLEVPISNGCHVVESSHVHKTSAIIAETSNSIGVHDKGPCNTPLLDGTFTIHNESHMETLSTASSCISDALRKVSMFSPGTFQNVTEYIDLKALTFIPVSPAKEAADRCDMKAKGSSKEDKRRDNLSQPLPALATVAADARKVDDNEECIRPKDEISSVLDSESILVLTSSRNATRGTICEQSHFSHIKFYRNFDVPLGKFLQDNLFNQSSLCKACQGLPEAHFYYYAHHNKQLTIRVKCLGDKGHLPGESEGKLWMWSRCSKCKPEMDKASKRVLISTAARGLSFGKFLELSFSSHSSFNRLSTCGHSFRKDFLYFFGLGSMVAMFRYSRVTTYMVSVPAEKMEFDSLINRDWLQQEIESVYAKGLLVFTEVANYVKKLESQFCSSNLFLHGSPKAFSDILEVLKLERSEFEENIKNTGIKNESSHNSDIRLLYLNRLRWEILLEACVWDRRLQLLLSSSPVAYSSVTDRVVLKQKDLEESGGKETEGFQIAAGSEVQEQTAHRLGEEVERTEEAADEAVQRQMISVHSEGTMSRADKVMEEQTRLEDHHAGEVEGMLKAADNKLFDAIIEGREVSVSCTDVEVQIECGTGADKLLRKELPCGGMHQSGVEQDLMCLPMSQENVQGRTLQDSISCVSSLPESESKDLSSNCDGHHTDNSSSAGNLSEEGSVSVIVDGEEKSCYADNYVLERHNSQALLNSDDSRGWIWSRFAVIREGCLKDLNEGIAPKFGHLPKFELLHSPEFLPTVSQVIIEEGARLHLPVSICDYIVADYDGEISSSVACALAVMKDLMPAGPDSDENTTLKRALSEPSGWSLSSSYDADIMNSAPSLPPPESRFSSFDGLNLLDSLISYGLLHPEVNLGVEKYPVKGKYSVVIMYANEFRGLRNHCCPSELDYIASLSRCKIWDAKGGKSKSFFAKTLDDRLIIKEIKQRELESFMKFAPQYFHHIKQSFASRNQTCLAKVLGIYQVTVRHPKNGKETKHDLMVQENLSFGRNINRQYDLKGALHARFTPSADGSGDVLLDQNFVNDMNSSPLYIGQKSKRLLQRAVWNDTTFLNSINVMDYSLLVGVDRQRRELVCGIIDYLRQYTWDKQLETWVKSSLVVPKNVLPTIISPGEYKKRFRKFMDTHFLTVPDHWCSHRSSNPCRLCGIKGDDSSLVKSEKREEELNGISSP